MRPIAPHTHCLISIRMIEHPNARHGTHIVRLLSQSSWPRVNPRARLHSSHPHPHAHAQTRTHAPLTHMHTQHTLIRPAAMDPPACSLTCHATDVTGTSPPAVTRQRPRDDSVLPCVRPTLSPPAPRQASPHPSRHMQACAQACLSLCAASGASSHTFEATRIIITPPCSLPSSLSLREIGTPSALAPRSSFAFLRSDPRALADHSSQQAARRTAAETCAVRRL